MNQRMAEENVMSDPKDVGKTNAGGSHSRNQIQAEL